MSIPPRPIPPPPPPRPPKPPPSEPAKPTGPSRSLAAAAQNLILLGLILIGLAFT